MHNLSNSPFGVGPSLCTEVMSLRSIKLGTDARRVLGGLLPLIDEPSLRDVLIHVHDGEGRLFVDRGAGAEHVRGWAAPEEAINRFAVALIAAGGRHLDELNPCADVRIGDGIRVHAVLAPVAAFGTVVSIRVPATHAASFEELAKSGLCGRVTESLLVRDVADRRNLLITGGTGSGKTTLLTSLLSLAHPSERIITIEDVAELRPRHDHHIALEARQTNIEGAGEVSLERLLREALRMRPDRIVLGECRGAEVATLLAALNTGHEGGAGTLHANSLSDVPARLEALGFLAGLPPGALARQVVSAFHTIVHVNRKGDHHRIEQVGRFILTHSGELEVEAREMGSA